MRTIWRPATTRRTSLVMAVAAAAAGAGLVLGLSGAAHWDQPLALACVVALLGGVEYGVVACREGRRARLARERDRLREDLVPTVSHELRAPQAPIKGWASILLQFGDRLDDDDRRAALEGI